MPARRNPFGNLSKNSVSLIDAFRVGYLEQKNLGGIQLDHATLPTHDFSRSERLRVGINNVLEAATDKREALKNLYNQAGYEMSGQNLTDGRTPWLDAFSKAHYYNDGAEEAVGFIRRLVIDPMTSDDNWKMLTPYTPQHTIVDTRNKSPEARPRNLAQKLLKKIGFS